MAHPGRIMVMPVGNEPIARQLRLFILVLEVLHLYPVLARQLTVLFDFRIHASAIR